MSEAPPPANPLERAGAKFRRHVEAEIIESFLRASLEAETIKQAIIETCRETGRPRSMVERVVKRASLVEQARAAREELVLEIVRDKIPLAREIVGLSLATVLELVQDIAEDETRKAEMGLEGISQLLGIATKANELLRLEQGKTTANIGVGVSVSAAPSMERAAAAIAKLAAIDPVFTYPKVTHPGLPVSVQVAEGDGSSDADA